ncbi:MAG: zinc-binding dehydrogenase [Pseudomonadota bacterium]
MKAAVTTGELRQISVEEVPRPEVKEGFLLLKTNACSICGTDLEYLDNSLAYRPGGALKPGAILGHEFCAEVVEVGAGVEDWQVGDRATMSGFRPTCGECYFCRRRLNHLCHGKGGERGIYTQHSATGYGGRTGALAEYILRPPSALLRIPDQISDEEAALVEPLNVSAGGVQIAETEPGDTMVIIGAGKIGLGALLVAKASGVAPVIVVDVHRNRLDKALEMGADIVLNAKEQDVIEEVTKVTIAGPDVVLICVRDGEVFNESVDMVRRGGKIVVVGQIPPTEVNPGMWIPKQLKIYGLFRQTPMIHSLNLIAKGLVDLKPMITEKMPLTEVQRGFDDMWSGKNIVSVIQP